MRDIALIEFATWARARALHPRPGDVASPADLRTFARECSEQSRRVA